MSIPTATLARTCPIWRDKAVRFIADERPDLVVVTGSRHYPNTDQEWRDGFRTTLARLDGLTTVAADWFTPMLEAIVMPFLRGS